jgi:hypothetical protein
VGNGVKVGGKGKGKTVVFLPPSPRNHEWTIVPENSPMSVDYIMG